MATNVRLKDAAGNVLHPETDWSVVQNKPSIFPTNWANVSNKPDLLEYSYIGVYKSVGTQKQAVYSLAFCYYDSSSSTYKYYYFDMNGQVQAFTPSSNFNLYFLPIKNILQNS